MRGQRYSEETQRFICCETTKIFTIQEVGHSASLSKGTRGKPSSLDTGTLITKIIIIIIMHYSVYRGISVECDVLRSLQSSAVVETLEKKASECFRIFGFDSPSRQFIYALSWGLQQKLVLD